MLRLVLLRRLHLHRLRCRLLPPGRPHHHLLNRPQGGVLVQTTAAKTLSTGHHRLVRFHLRHHQHRVLHHPPVLHLRLHGGLLMILGQGSFRHGPCPGPLRPPSVLRRHTQVPGNPAFGRLLVLPGSQPPTVGQCLSRRPDVCSLWSLHHQRWRLLHTSAGPAPDATPTTAGQCLSRRPDVCSLWSLLHRQRRLLHSPAGPTAFTIVSAGTAPDATLTCDAELGSSCFSPGHE